jgi:hypothetical protein
MFDWNLFVVLEIELRALCMLGKRLITWVTVSALLFLFCFLRQGLTATLALADLKLKILLPLPTEYLGLQAWLKLL